MQLSLDSTRVAMIATKFFEQCHSDVIVKDVTNEGEIWRVNVSLGLINKKNKQVKIDAKTGIILEYTSTDYEKLADEVLAIGESMRYVLIIDEKGTNLTSKMKEGKTMFFKNADQVNMLPSELRTLRELLKFHNDDLGQVRFVNIMRDRVNIFVFFMPGVTICASCESDRSPEVSLMISEKARSIIKKSMD